MKNEYSNNVNAKSFGSHCNLFRACRDLPFLFLLCTMYIQIILRAKTYGMNSKKKKYKKQKPDSKGTSKKQWLNKKVSMTGQRHRIE